MFYIGFVMIFLYTEEMVMKQFLLMNLFFMAICIAMNEASESCIPLDMLRQTKSESNIMVANRKASPRMNLLRRESTDKLNSVEHEGERQTLNTIKKVARLLSNDNPHRLTKTRSRSYDAATFVRMDLKDSK
jgi:hypothetical protein